MYIEDKHSDPNFNFFLFLEGGLQGPAYEFKFR